MCLNEQLRNLLLSLRELRSQYLHDLLIASKCLFDRTDVCSKRLNCWPLPYQSIS